MILTTVDHLCDYSSLNPLFLKAFSALAVLAEREFTGGRHEIEGSDLFINAAEYDTHEEDGAVMEAHRAYIDVMWMLQGCEQIGVCPQKEMTEITMPYDTAGDAILSEIPDGCTYIQMKPGCVCILFPEDGHAPGLNLCGTSHIRKLIAKVRVR